MKEYDNRKFSEIAEDWHKSNGGTVPPRDSPEWIMMYEAWVEYAFRNFRGA